MPTTSTLRLAQRYEVLEERSVTPIPRLITENLRPGIILRPYQQTALSRFVFHLEKDDHRKRPTELLFSMATGSGKTVVMAGAILYLYSRGYRNFVFFVDKTNIVLKTRDNFLQKSSAKYLFRDPVVIHGNEVVIREVENFESGSPDAINIIFTTLAGLHSRIRNSQENSVTLDDFKREKTVFISDEAHHVNALTRAGEQEERELEASWEWTIRQLVESHRDNVLLEFTATIGWNDQNIARKYAERVLIEYDLPQFRNDGYSKDVFLHRSEASLEGRILQALVISEYRRQLAESRKKALKPVVLLKSNRINAQQYDYERFRALVDVLEAKDIAALKKIAMRRSESRILLDALTFYEESNISDSQLARILRAEFSHERCVVINGTITGRNPKLLNTLVNLEDATNPIRAVFDVEVLNEGWDVLNLFDIVRLYDERGRIRATIREAQLIGRGARYWPFRLNDSQPLDRRKFDNDLGNPLRALEQMHFHSKEDHRYIGELKEALKQTGFAIDESVELPLRLKGNFRKSPFYRRARVFVNSREETTGIGVAKLSDAVGRPLEIHVASGFSGDTAAFETNGRGRDPEYKTTSMVLGDLSAHAVRKAMDKLPFFHYDNLRRYFPKLTSIKEFIAGSKYLGRIRVDIHIPQGGDLVMTSEVFIQLVHILGEVQTAILAHTATYRGSREFKPQQLATLINDKKIQVTMPTGVQERGRSMSGREYEAKNGVRVPPTDQALRLNLDVRDWYVYEDDFGTDQEKWLVKFVDGRIEKLKKRYSEIYLIRNERVITLYTFKEGLAFQPDYLLCLVQRKAKVGKRSANRVWQIFIEPKGEFLSAEDKPKENFLKDLQVAGLVKTLLDTDQYRVLGLPFYNRDEETAFEKVFDGAF